jgi:hypothetical protein
VSYDPVRGARGQVTCERQFAERKEAEVMSSGDFGVV